MTIQRMAHVGVVVDDLDAANWFFVELGMELDGGTTPVEGDWVDPVVGLDDDHSPSVGHLVLVPQALWNRPLRRAALEAASGGGQPLAVGPGAPNVRSRWRRSSTTPQIAVPRSGHARGWYGETATARWQVIPTLILGGLGLGLMPRQWEHRVSAIVALSLLMALAWGLLVGALLGGALFALVNIALGIPLGLGIQRLLGLGLQALGYAVVHRPSDAQRTQRR